MLVPVHRHLKLSSSQHSRRVLIGILALMTSHSNWQVAFRSAVLSSYVFGVIGKEEESLTIVCICSVTAFTASHMHDHLVTLNELSIRLV